MWIQFLARSKSDTRISRRRSGLASIPPGEYGDSGQNLGKISEIAPGILANFEAENGPQGNPCDIYVAERVSVGSKSAKKQAKN